jgi:hypothetical protein
MTERDHIGPDPLVWIERLMEVNRGSQFKPSVKEHIARTLRMLHNDLRRESDAPDYEKDEVEGHD